MSNTFMKFIDSCVGAIARKVQDEFDENKHPRDKGGKFTSKGNEGRGGGADDEGYMGLSKEELAEEEEYENSRERARREKDDDRVTGPEDRDYMNEEDDVGEELIQVKRAAKAARRFKSSGIDLASAMEDLDIPTEGVPKKYLESVFEGSLSEDPKLLRKAEDYIERYESGELEKEADRLGSEEDGDEDSESEESESSVEDIQKSLRHNVASSVEDLLEYTKDDGYDAELVSDEFMIVRKDDKEYRAHIDRAGSSYYVDRVEEW